MIHNFCLLQLLAYFVLKIFIEFSPIFSWIFNILKQSHALYRLAMAYKLHII